MEEQKMHLNVSFDMRVAASKHPKRPSYKAELAKNAKSYKNTKSVSPQSKLLQEKALPRNERYGETSAEPRKVANVYHPITLEGSVERKPRQSVPKELDPYTPMDLQA